MEEKSLVIGVGVYGGVVASNFINWLDESIARNDLDESFPYSAIAARPFYTSSQDLLNLSPTTTEPTPSFKPRVLLAHRPSNSLTDEPKISHQRVWDDVANFKPEEVANVTLREFQRPLWESQDAYDSAIRLFLEQSDSLSTFHIIAELPDYLLNRSSISLETFILDEVPKAALSVYTSGNIADDNNSFIFTQHLADYIDQFRPKSSKILIPIISQPIINKEEQNLAKLAFRTALSLDALTMPYRLLKLSPHSTLDLLRPTFTPLVDVASQTILRPQMHSGGQTASQMQTDWWLLNSATDTNNKSNHKNRPFHRRVIRGAFPCDDAPINSSVVSNKPYFESAKLLFGFPEVLPLPIRQTDKENSLGAIDGLDNSLTNGCWDSVSYKMAFFGGGLDKNYDCSSGEGEQRQHHEGGGVGYLTSSISWIESARLNSEIIGRSERDEWDSRLEILRDIYEESAREGLLPSPLLSLNEAAGDCE